MPRAFNRPALGGALILVLLLGCALPPGGWAQSRELSPPAAEATTITNLAQLARVLALSERLYGNVRLEGVVCAASRPELGLVVLRDTTGVELLELGGRSESVSPGDRVRVEGPRLLLRRRDLGTQISAAPVVNNDGLHAWRPLSGEVSLKAGRVRFELDWFNCLHNSALELSCQPPNGRMRRIPESAFAHTAPGETNLSPGLWAECFEGFWESVPDFDLLQPVKTGTATNVDLRFRTQDERVGLRFTGFYVVPGDGRYTFQVGADDGALLFLGPSEAPIERLGSGEVPQPQAGLIGEPMSQLDERRWLWVKGRVSFAARTGQGLDLELRSGADTLPVKVADATGLEPNALLNTYVRVVGVGRAALSSGQRMMLDRVVVPDSRGLQVVEFESGASTASPLPMVTIRQVQTMRVGDAKRELPVRIRGVVTACSRSERWVSLQDDTRGIFVDLRILSNSFPSGVELWEVVGHTASGNFAPVVVAERITRLGQARMPEPDRPSWSELANGSMDVQWVEFQGLVSGVQSNRLSLLLPGGSLEVYLENHLERDLRRYRQALVRVRGALFAIWNADTREVQFGSLRMRNASVSLEVPPPSDPFSAPAKTVRELLLFDAQATPFRPVKVQAQVLCVDARGLFCTDDGLGLRVLAEDRAGLGPGDRIEAVGYPEISGPSPLLRQALVRKIGSGPLPVPRLLAGPDWVGKGLDSTWVRVEGRLIARHSEPDATVLELQSNGQLVVARVRRGGGAVSPRLGSQLDVSGVFAEVGRDQRLGTGIESFSLLVDSPAGIKVLSQPSWWTLERLATMVGILLVVLLLAAGWITQLRRQVEQRTAQLQREIRERERAEHHHALEAERSRIARDLHDDLGSSLTEIGALASTGRRAEPAGDAPALFDAIAGKARGSISALDVIVWAVDPEDNSLQSLADYLSGFAGDYLGNSSVACRFRIPVSFPPVMLEGRVRHDLFLAVKETLNNVVRHSGAHEVEFGIAVTPDALEIAISDNGKGFDVSTVANGNGLKNLRSRLERLGGSSEISSTVGDGTNVTIRLPLPVPETAHDSAA